MGVLLCPLSMIVSYIVSLLTSFAENHVLVLVQDISFMILRVMINNPVLRII